MGTGTKPKAADSANLDVLRALAVAYVVAAHFLHFLGIHRLGFVETIWAGRLGVLFFFVHTCLVLMMSLERSAARLGGWRLFASFYVRRIFRIYPLSIACVLLVILLGFPAPVVPEALRAYSFALVDVVSNLLLIQNLTLKPSIVGVLWSLPLEVQMYLVLPPLFLLVRRYRSLWMLVGMWAAALPLALLQPRFAARLGLLAYLPDFLPGVMAYVLMRRQKPVIPGWLWIPAVVTLSAVFLLQPSWPWGWIISLVLGLMIPQFREMSAPSLTSAAQQVAKYSYGVYLAHNLCIWLAFVVFRTMPVTAQAMLFATLLVAFPVAAYHLVEDPMIRAGMRLAGRIVPRRKQQPEQVRRAAA